IFDQQDRRIGDSLPLAFSLFSCLCPTLNASLPPASSPTSPLKHRALPSAVSQSSLAPLERPFANGSSIGFVAARQATRGLARKPSSSSPFFLFSLINCEGGMQPPTATKGRSTAIDSSPPARSTVMGMQDQMDKNRCRSVPLPSRYMSIASVQPVS